MDEIELSIFQSKMDLISEEMGMVLGRTAQSTIFAESHDYSCFLSGPDGHVVSYADGIPMHTGVWVLAFNDVSSIGREKSKKGMCICSMTHISV